MNALADALAGFWLGLANHLWQSSLVLVVFLLLDLILRRAPAALRADLWTLGLLKLALPAALGGAAFGAVARRLGGEVPALGTVVATVLAPAREDGGASNNWLPALLMLVSAVWLVGVAVGSWHLGRDLRAQSCLLAGARPVVEDRLRQAAARAGLPLERLLVAPGVTLPLVLGLWSPRVLVPEHLAHVVGPTGLVALLRHEDRHRRRRDPLRLLLGRVLVILFWFFSPVRWVLRRYHECSEFACDEAALEGGALAEEYLRALARAVHLGLDPGPPVAAAASGGPHLLSRRLTRLRREERPNLQGGRWLLMSALLVVAVSVLLPLDLVARKPAQHETVAMGDARNATPQARSEGNGRAPGEQSGRGEGRPVVAPRIVKLVEPGYPASVRGSGIEGAVTLQAVIDRGGRVVDVDAVEEIEGQPDFTRAATRALERCSFEAGTVGGRPARMLATITFNFKAG